MSTEGRPAERVQSVRNAWINALRDETLRVRNREQARVAHVGQMIATYADADGGNAFPSQETLAVLVGGTDEAVSRAVRVLIAVGMLAKKRRPNAPAVYQLLMPVKRPDWMAHMHLYTETRQKRARTAHKARQIEELIQGRTPSQDGIRTPSQDGIRTPSPAGVPEPVPAGGSGTRPRTVSANPEPVLGRPRNPSPDAFRNPSQAGGTSTPTSGRDPYTDHNLPQHPQQPQVRAGTRSENDQAAAQPPQAQINFILCGICEEPMVPRPGRTAHAHCTAKLAAS